MASSLPTRYRTDDLTSNPRYSPQSMSTSGLPLMQRMASIIGSPKLFCPSDELFISTTLWVSSSGFTSTLTSHTPVERLVEPNTDCDPVPSPLPNTLSKHASRKESLVIWMQSSAVCPWLATGARKNNSASSSLRTSVTLIGNQVFELFSFICRHGQFVSINHPIESQHVLAGEAFIGG